MCTALTNCLSAQSEMAAFPTQWDIHDDADFATFNQEDQSNAPMGLATLMRLDLEGRSIGVYKACIFGGGIIDLNLRVNQLLQAPPADIADLTVRLSVRADRANIALNATTSAWRDLLLLLRSNAVIVLDQGGAIVSAAPIIRYLEAHASNANVEISREGSSIRWAVAVNNEGNIQLELQCLPIQARYLTKEALKRDNCVSVLLGTFPLNVDMFMGKNPGGPVPIFFAEDRDRAHAQITANPELLRTDIATVNAQFLCMEHVSMEEAHTYLQGRARTAKGKQAFPPAPGPPNWVYFLH